MTNVGIANNYYANNKNLTLTFINKYSLLCYNFQPDPYIKIIVVMTHNKITIFTF